MRNFFSSGWTKLIFIGVLSPLLICPWADESSPSSGAQEQRIEITIRDSTFVRTKTAPIHPGFSTETVIRNEDHIRHGFTSSMLAGLFVHGKGEGIESYGKGIDGFYYVDPGKTLGASVVADGLPQCACHGGRDDGLEAGGISGAVVRWEAGSGRKPRICAFHGDNSTDDY